MCALLARHETLIVPAKLSEVCRTSCRCPGGPACTRQGRGRRDTDTVALELALELSELPAVDVAVELRVTVAVDMRVEVDCVVVADDESVDVADVERPASPTSAVQR